MPSRRARCGRVSTHALQALSLFNSDFMQEQSRGLRGASARRTASRTTGRATIDHAWQSGAVARAAYSRGTDSWRKKFLAPAARLPDMCLALFNRNEFVYVP